jgi:hypothetical protein
VVRNVVVMGIVGVVEVDEKKNVGVMVVIAEVVETVVVVGFVVVSEVAVGFVVVSEVVVEGSVRCVLPSSKDTYFVIFLYEIGPCMKTKDKILF